MRKIAVTVIYILLIFLFTGCGKKADLTEAEEPETAVEAVEQEETAEDDTRGSGLIESDIEESDIKESVVEENGIGSTGDMTEAAHDEKPSESENKYYIVEYNPDLDKTDYGDIKQEQEEFQDQEGNTFFYYEIECFYFDETYPAILNETLQIYYDSKKATYRQDSETYTEDSYISTPCDSLIFFYVTYVGDDYVSMVFNDVNYPGGAHPISALEGITIDCSTGEIVAANRFIDDSEEEIGERIKAALGTEVFTPKEWDYFITDKSVIFFYFNPRFMKFVETKRLR